jgi:predicted DNA-binding transcriptional regulator AlpA
VKNNLSRLPGWPRWLTTELAAAYLGVSAGTFIQLRKTSDFPRPYALAADGGLLRYDRYELDEWSDRKRGAADWGEPKL